jgi:hypothetical protein
MELERNAVVARLESAGSRSELEARLLEVHDDFFGLSRDSHALCNRLSTLSHLFVHVIDPLAFLFAFDFEFEVIGLDGASHSHENFARDLLVRDVVRQVCLHLQMARVEFCSGINVTHLLRKFN